MTGQFWRTVNVHVHVRVNIAAYSVVNDLIVAAIEVLLVMLLRSHPTESRWGQ